MLDAVLSRLRDQPSRTGSLIVTLFGDAIVPRGGVVWIGTLLEIFRAMGVGEGVVRTAVSRLSADGWLDGTRRGRNSFYRLSARGRAETDAATPRIYGPLLPDWDGHLTLVLAEPGPERQSLLDAGFGTVMPGMFVSPAAAPPGLPVMVLRAETDPDTLRRLAAKAWPLADLARRYQAVLETFAMTAAPRPLEALITRMLLIHEYRRAVLRDPRLPLALLPENWPGPAARCRVAALYARLAAPSESWLDAHATAEAGSLPPADPRLRRRFAGPNDTTREQ